MGGRYNMKKSSSSCLITKASTIKCILKVLKINIKKPGEEGEKESFFSINDKDMHVI